MTATKHRVQCPTCRRSGLESTWKFYVPAHTVPGTNAPCENSDKGTRPNHSADGKQQLCFKCGKYVSRMARFCPRCDK